MFTCFQYFNQTLSVFPVEFTREANICDCVNHQFFVGLACKWIFSIFWFYFRIKSRGWLLTMVLGLWLSSENIWTSMVALRSLFWHSCFWCFEWTYRFMRRWQRRRILILNGCFESWLFDLVLVLSQIWIFASFALLQLVILFQRNRLILT